jgi:two-component system NtrC family sensor kinase
VGALQAEIVRLNKVVRALVNRAERESAGRSAISASPGHRDAREQGPRRTTELEAALRENERINRDLTREREEQRVLIRKLEEAHNQLLQSEKLASIATGGRRRAQINNPIGFVHSNLGS